MINPDGVIVGNTRCSLTGRDLNRQYKSVIKEAFPPVFHLKALFRRLMEEHGIVFYCDLHAHSRRFNVFLYGCENRRHSEKFLKEQVFPLMLHKNTSEKFSFDDCRFRIQRQKESTGRVVFWNMGITCSYTLEASYGGTNLGSRAYTHFNTDDYEGIGRYFCETLQDFLNPCPINEQLRMKIVSRLVKEGSTADEPSNIALTDYSSLSSADLSSTCDEEDTHCQQVKKNRRLRSRRERAKNMAQMTKTLDLRKVASYVHFGSPNPFLKKSGSERALDEKTSTKGKKNERRKFKRSLTMASIPTALLQPPRSHTGLPLPDRPLSPRIMELRHSEGLETKFTIGTSDESEDDDTNDDDLQKLFCPLTDSLGSPFEYQGTKSEQLSASSCRRVQSEILASVSKIKLLGQGRGLLSSYSSSSHIGQGDSSDGESSRCLTPIKIVATLPDDLNQMTMGKKKIPSISVSIPSNAAQETKPEKKKKSGKKSWEKYNRMRKACKVLEKSGDGAEPSVRKTEVTEVKTLLATVNMTPTNVVKIKKRKKKKSVVSVTKK
ncbi:hypothetical protein TCAL_04730 [Tigriopus californicus]|uniref:Peptidase M14 domain-containing protein n=3 Tax=Tigriopus californicus TaxID=6832 RepID=A0A553PRY5_TIGCA|nr:hypothetical protein TCAL_04730 [Tigriopus californicus]